MPTLGLHLTTFPANPSDLTSYIRDIGAALDAGAPWSALWLTDHFRQLGPEGADAPMLEPYALLANIAGCTSRIQLGVLATSVLYRSPTLLAKTVTSLDALSLGRAVLGIGAGHPRTESEAREYGFEFPSVPERMGLLDDALRTIRAMTGATVDPAVPVNQPRPVNPAGIPVLVAGSGEQRLLRIAAQHADMINLSFPSGDTLERLPHKLDVLASHCASVGREPATIQVTYKAVVSIAPDRAEAQRGFDQWRQARGFRPVGANDGVFVGEPGDVAEQAAPFFDAGVDQLVIEFAGQTDVKTIELTADAFAGLAQ